MVAVVSQTPRTSALITLQLMDLLIAILMSVQYKKAKVSVRQTRPPQHSRGVSPAICHCSLANELTPQTGFGVSNHILEVLISVVIRNGVLVLVVMIAQFAVSMT